MKRRVVSGSNGFARFGIHPHRVRVSNTYRGGVRF